MVLLKFEKRKHAFKVLEKKKNYSSLNKSRLKF